MTFRRDLQRHGLIRPDHSGGGVRLDFGPTPEAKAAAEFISPVHADAILDNYDALVHWYHVKLDQIRAMPDERATANALKTLTLAFRTVREDHFGFSRLF